MINEGTPDQTTETVHGFNDNDEDTAECIMNFTDLEEAAFNDFNHAGAQLLRFYGTILRIKKTSTVDIINNTDFINWVMTYPGE